MRITITEAAEAYIRQAVNGRDGFLRVVYDTDGCGCAVNGVPALWHVAEPAPNDAELEANGPVRFWVDRMQTIFFEESLKLDTRPDGRSLRLYSDNQIYNASMRIIDRTTASAN